MIQKTISLLYVWASIASAAELRADQPGAASCPDWAVCFPRLWVYSVFTALIAVVVIFGLLAALAYVVRRPMGKPR